MTDLSPQPWRLVVEFLGIDLDDDDVLDALIDPARNIQWSSSEGVTTADAVIPAESVEEAFAVFDEILDAAAPEATLIRLVDPLVSTTDIAEDAGVTRQAVRNWTLGTRQSGFPRPLGIVGDGVRVWRHADVDAWLTAAVNLGSGYRYPSARFVSVFNDGLARQIAGIVHGADGGGEGADAPDDDGWEVSYSDRSVQTDFVARRPVRPARPPERSEASTVS